jgi:hypothetical protein
MVVPDLHTYTVISTRQRVVQMVEMAVVVDI